MFDIILFSFHMHFLKSEYMKSREKKNPFILHSFSNKSNKERRFEPIFYENWETVEQFPQQLSLLLAESNGKSFYSPTHLIF